MYSGNNIKAIQSQRWLAAALCELMKEKPFEKITIGDICLSADLSRQTFYNLFDSKEEILRFSLREAYEERFKELAQHINLSADDIVESFAYVVSSRQDLLDVMNKNNLGGVISDEIGRCVSLFAGKFVPADEKDEAFPYIEAMTAGALSSLLTYWLKQENPLKKDKLSALLAGFLSSTVYNLSQDTAQISR